MILQMERLCTVDQISDFPKGNETVDQLSKGRDGAYEFVRRTRGRTGHEGLGRSDKSAVRKYLVTGLWGHPCHGQNTDSLQRVQAGSRVTCRSGSHWKTLVEQSSNFTQSGGGPWPLPR